MRKSKVCYCNITYKCNNVCDCCVSYNVKRHNPKEITIDDYKLLREQNSIGEDDIWTISGGEPTMSPYFADIINYCYQYSSHIIVYSNGRNLSTIPVDIINRIERIIIPLYGVESIHNQYVGSAKAYKETIKSIERILEFNKNKIDLKILLAEDNETEMLMNSQEWNVLKYNSHFSVTRLLDESHPLCSRLVNSAERVIRCLVSAGKKVRFYDFPFCWFSKIFQKEISEMPLHLSNIDRQVICGTTGGRQILFSFNKRSDYFAHCSNCVNAIYCTMIMKNYFCPSIEDGKILITTE